MNGSDACRPTCGGVLIPDEPATAANLPPIITVVASPWISGAENGMGGPGCGAPVAALGIWWPLHVAVILSPMTAAAVPMASSVPARVHGPPRPLGPC